MRVLIVRHGHAVGADENSQRPLSSHGRVETEKTAKFIRQTGVTVQRIMHGPKLRAEQTAKIIADVINPPGGLVMAPQLTPDGPADPVIDELLTDDGDMIVSHLPQVERILGTLVTPLSSKSPVAFYTATAACVTREDGHAWLTWLVSPEFLNATDQ